MLSASVTLLAAGVLLAALVRRQATLVRGAGGASIAFAFVATIISLAALGANPGDELRRPPHLLVSQMKAIHRSVVDHEPAAAINPVAFPYEIKRLRGNVRIAGGEIQMTGIEGEHNRTWISCNGTGTYSGTGWNIRLEDMLVGSLRVDEDLLVAMPHTLQSACRAMQFEGLLNVAGAISLSGEGIEPNSGATGLRQNTLIPFVDVSAKQSPVSTSLNWDVRLDMDGARVNVGMQLENVNGNVRLRGSFDGRQATCGGELNIDSLSLYEMQITNIQGPIWIDSERVGVGLFATPANSNVAGQSLTGQLHSGQIQFDAQTWQENGHKFYLQTTLANAQLKPLARLWAPQMTRLNGLAQGALRLSGDCESRESFRGEGLVQLHNAQLFELPVFLSMFKQLSRPDLDNSAFDSSIGQFTIQGEQISFNRMEFIGDTLSLIGNGTINADQEIDFNFFTVMGRNRFYFPVLSELAQASSQQILWISVDGTLEHPQPHRKILPALNEGLKQLLGTSDTNAGFKRQGQPSQLPEIHAK